MAVPARGFASAGGEGLVFAYAKEPPELLNRGKLFVLLTFLEEQE